MNVPNPALLQDLAAELLAEEELARQALLTGKAPGPTTGFKALDEDLGGYLAPGLHALLAAPGAGKTSLALQIASQCGCPALYVTTEMRRAELLRRIVSRTTGKYLGKLRGGTLTPAELQSLIRQAAEAAPMLALYDATRQETGPAAIQDAAHLLRQRFDSPHVFIIMDSVTDWAAAAEGDEYAATESALNGLKQIAVHLTCPILVIAHRNRPGQQAKGAAKLHTGKGTGRYEYVAESVWDLDSDVSVKFDHNGRRPATLELLKSRHGSTGGKAKLEFEGRLQKFIEVQGGADDARH